MMNAFGKHPLNISCAGVKFYPKNAKIPPEVLNYHISDISNTACNAARQALLGDAVCLTIENIGCIASAISLGLVDRLQDKPLKGKRVYTELMREHTEEGQKFTPPSPKDFTDGNVYACGALKKFEFCLFGKSDSGRYRDIKTARKAIKNMPSIQPPSMKAVFIYAADFEDINIIPDVVLFDIRPVELTRIIQGYQFITSKRLKADMAGLRGVCSDLIVIPYLKSKINISSYCLGARILAKFEPDKLGLGIPFKLLPTIVKGMENSKTGYPFHLYHGAYTIKK